MINDSANQNSQNEINNANQNSQNEIDNANQNSQNEIDALSCPTGPHQFEYSNILNTATNQYLNSDGTISTGTSYAISPWIQVKPNTYYEVSNVRDLERVRRVCEYDANNNNRLISCHTSRSFTTSSTTQYIRINTYVFSVPSLKGPVCNDWQQEQLQKNNQTQNETNDLLKDDSVDQSQANNFFSSFNDDNHGLSSIITLPLQTIQSLTSSQCVTLHLPIPFTNNEFLDLPCMSQVYQSNVPDLYSMWQVVCYGLIGYWIATDVFRLVKGLKDPDNDKIEVLDL